MKNQFKILLITVLLNVCFSSSSKCQIVLEQDYDTSGFKLEYVNFQINGGKYVRLLYPDALGIPYPYARKMEIYNLNHSLWKTIPLDNISPYPDTIEVNYEIRYISDSLFDTDNLVEFLLAIYYPYNTGTNFYEKYQTYIYNENLNLLFSDTSAGIWSAYSQDPFPAIFNTSVGTKMILNSGRYDYHIDSNKIARVYSLPGQLNRNPYGLPTGEESNEPTAMKMNLYPNPSAGNVTVEYDLPPDVPQAELVFYDVNGKKIKSFKIDHTFHNLYLSSNDLASGTYFCQIETAKGALGLKKMIRVDY